MYEQLKTYDRMQKEFIDIAAHELRTPIQPILGLTVLLFVLIIVEIKDQQRHKLNH
jgi:signal transduction histidine kinase